MSTTKASGTDWLRQQTKRIDDGSELPVTTQAAATVEVEAWLQRHGIRYAPPTQIPLALIDEKRSRSNQARREPIVLDSVDRFAAAMKAGASFPPIVCYPVGGRLTIVDGNNREAAAKRAGKDKILGIVIDESTPSEIIQLLTVEANTRHGVTPDPTWRVQQAFHLCSLGLSDQAACDAANVSLATMRAARAVRDSDQRANALRITGFKDLPAGTRGALQALRDDPVFYQAARAAVDTGMTIEEVRNLIREVKSLSSEGARIEYIGGVVRSRATENATRKLAGKVNNRLSSPKNNLATGIGKILSVDTSALVRQILTVHDRDEVIKRIKAVDRKMDELKFALATLAHMDEE